MSPAPALATDATLLAFDTSTELLAVALGTPRGEHCDQRPGGAAASQALLPAIHALLRAASCRLSEVDAIAFGRGPGAFTGLRTSCAVAQGLALGLARPVLPIDSLLIVAEEARQQRHAAGEDGFEIAVAADARMGEVYAARYRWHDARWHEVEPPELCRPEELQLRWSAAPPAWLAGSALTAIPGFADSVPVPPERRIVQERWRAVALLALARQAAANHAGLDAAQALPLYLRDKVALTSAERVLARAA